MKYFIHIFYSLKYFCDTKLPVVPPPGWVSADINTWEPQTPEVQAKLMIVIFTEQLSVHLSYDGYWLSIFVDKLAKLMIVIFTEQLSVHLSNDGYWLSIFVDKLAIGKFDTKIKALVSQSTLNHIHKEIIKRSECSYLWHTVDSPRSLYGQVRGRIAWRVWSKRTDGRRNENP